MEWPVSNDLVETTREIYIPISAEHQLDGSKSRHRVGTLPPQVMEHFIDVVRDLSLAQDLNRIIEIVAQSARILTGADGATLVLRDGEMSYYANEDAIGPLWKGQRFPLNQCIGGWCMSHRQAVAIADVFADDRIPQAAYEPTWDCKIDCVKG